jgi:pimeloyl-ACP methyl ester carboxylesterase
VPDLGKVRVADFVSDVLDALEHLGDAVLVGHSMGGLVAQVAAAVDARVRAVALLCSVPPAGIGAVSGPVMRRAWRYLPPMATGGLIEERRADADALIMNRMTSAEREAAFPRFIADSGTVAREIALGRVKVDAARITCPVLVGGATDDFISPVAIHPKLVARYGAESVVFSGRGHLVTLEEGSEGRANTVLGWAERAVAGPPTS